ncbi:hypothetical protein PVAG01_09135 [Phlyctema vagabunda]|uniref:Uncharacterized protein n=1 Tax=Phlyctema vagabunda TaxID=108571 RepID=A0ABR4P6H7_9HELO
MPFTAPPTACLEDQIAQACTQLSLADDKYNDTQTSPTQSACHDDDDDENNSKNCKQAVPFCQMPGTLHTSLNWTYKTTTTTMPATCGASPYSETTTPASVEQDATTSPMTSPREPTSTQRLLLLPAPTTIPFGFGATHAAGTTRSVLSEPAGAAAAPPPLPASGPTGGSAFTQARTSKPSRRFHGRFSHDPLSKAARCLELADPYTASSRCESELRGNLRPNGRPKSKTQGSGSSSSIRKSSKKKKDGKTKGDGKSKSIKARRLEKYYAGLSPEDELSERLLATSLTKARRCDGKNGTRKVKGKAGSSSGLLAQSQTSGNRTAADGRATLDGGIVKKSSSPTSTSTSLRYKRITKRDRDRMKADKEARASLAAAEEVCVDLDESIL